MLMKMLKIYPPKHYFIRPIALKLLTREGAIIPDFFNPPTIHWIRTPA